ncbi:MAG: ABC transporter ATP-binding protein [Treponema sp.]|jgi:ABC-2 type transport system ATP-binding protein|nr:ABC transporter ATP-binding protein [Treponema sp.]
MIEVNDVSIRYIVGDFKDIGIKEFIMKKLTGDYHVHEFWAVDGVSFSLQKGELLGIIGRNGAGKSTLLKAISQIMIPTKGTIKVEGKVVPLFGFGTGLIGDLTVRDNIFLRGALLGYSREFINEKYPEILDFSELGPFEYRRVKHLSSGMVGRLAFSISCFIEPEILILDEVFASGDGAFGVKSEKKMMEIINSGITVILVTHSTGRARNICTKALWLDRGKQVAFGDPAEVCTQYEEFLKSK